MCLTGKDALVSLTVLTILMLHFSSSLIQRQIKNVWQNLRLILDTTRETSDVIMLSLFSRFYELHFERGLYPPPLKITVSTGRYHLS